MSNQSDKYAIVIGAGMAGLMAATVLSEFFEDVLIVEKDELPSTPIVRKGVPQGAHVHTFLGYAVEAMEDLLPGLMEELYDAGAVKIKRNHDIWFHDAVGPTPIRDVGILTPSVTRPLLEHVTRKRVLSRSNVRISEASRFLTYRIDHDGRVNGIQTQENGQINELCASLVLDCSGRASQLSKWLLENGYGEVPRQELGIGMTYTSGLFEPPPEFADDNWACLMLAVPPSTRAAYLTPVDGGLWLATMYGRAGDMAPPEQEGFIAWTEGLAHPIINEKLRRAKSVSDFRIYKIPKGVWFRYEQMNNFPKGVLPMGESMTSFNPMYGQGISLSAAQARALRSALDTPRDQLAKFYFKNCEQLNQVGWSVMETRDLEFASTSGARPHDIEDRWAIGKAIRKLAETDEEVHQLTVRVTHLLDPPSVLMRSDILERAQKLVL